MMRLKNFLLKSIKLDFDAEPSFGVNSLCPVMHQSIPAAPSPPPPRYRGAFARLVSPSGGAFANFLLPGDRAFANPGVNPELLTLTRFPIRI